MRATVGEQSLQDVIVEGRIRSVYQPIVDLSTGETVGFEALARGPAESQFEMPGQLFPAARRAGLRSELEGACLLAAFNGVVEAGLDGDTGLFVNLEPGLLDDAEFERLLALSELTRGRVRVFVELTERELTHDPTALFRSVDRMREIGLGIALDDVGADAESLALIPFLEPELIKLDLRLVQAHPRAEVAEIVHAVSAEAERTGARIIAEGIETEEHLARARGLGADLGQGWHFGHPGALEPCSGPLGSPIAVATRPESIGDRRSPFEIVSAGRPTRIGDKRLLLALSRGLEVQAGGRGGISVLLSTFQESRFFTDRVAERYAELADRLPLVGALGVGEDPRLAAGVRWAELEPDEPLRSEWDVTVVGPHFAAAFAGRDLGDGCDDMDRCFEFALTYERALAVSAARAMMRRLAAAS